MLEDAGVFERAFVDSLPGTATGGVTITVRSQLEGGEGDIGYHYRLSDQLRLDGLFGFRYLRLSEDLTIQDRLTALRGGSIRFQGTPLNAGDMLTDSDNFQTTNQFYGLLVGLYYRPNRAEFMSATIDKHRWAETAPSPRINISVPASSVSTEIVVSAPSSEKRF